MSNYPPEQNMGGQESSVPPGALPGPAPGGAPGEAPASGPLYYTNVDKDASDLNTLALCWYIWAGILLIPAAIFLVWLVVGTGFTLLGLSSRDAAPLAFMGGFFLCFGVFFIGMILTLSYFNYRCGRNLKERRGMTLCYVMAVIACLNIPLGLILAIFTFNVLSRPSVKASFR